MGKGINPSIWLGDLERSLKSLNKWNKTKPYTRKGGNPQRWHRKCLYANVIPSQQLHFPTRKKYLLTTNQMKYPNTLDDDPSITVASESFSRSLIVLLIGYEH